MSTVTPAGRTRSGSTLARVAIVLLLVLPVLGAAVYMWAMWDPKTYLRDIPLAVVTEDTGVGEGKAFSNYGNQIADGMTELNYLNFTKMSREEAQSKLERGELMMVVSIPSDFSTKAATIIDDNPVRPTINFELNDHYGTQNAFIVGSLIPELQASVSQAVTNEYATEVIAGLNDLSTGLGDAADGARQLDDGASQLQDGGAQAIDGISQLKDGSTQLRDGTGQLLGGTGDLKAGTTQLRDGAHQLSNGMDELRSGTGQLADGAGQINDGVKELTDMLIPLLSGVQGSVGNLRPAVDALRAAGLTSEANELAGLIKDMDPANPENLVTQLGKLRDGTAELYYNLSDPNAPYLSGVLQLQDGAHQLRDGTVELDNGAAQLNDGARQLNDGTIQLDDGMGELSTGAGELKNGMDQLKDGTNQLSTGLADGVRQAPTITKPDISATNMATPIDFTQSNLNPVQTSTSQEDPTAVKLTGGVSILLWILFAFLLMAIASMILPAYISKRTAASTSPDSTPAEVAEGSANGTAESTAAATRSKAVKAALSGFVLMAVVSIAIVGLMALAGTLFGWSPASWGAAVLLIVLVGCAGAALFHMLQTAFGRVPGSAAAVGVYVLGLLASGAIWPPDATPGPLKLLHVINPMSYARDAFIRMSIGIHDGLFTSGIVGLIILTVVFLAITVVLTQLRGRNVSPSH